MNHSSVFLSGGHNINDLAKFGSLDDARANLRGQADNCRLMHAVFGQILAQMSAVKEGSGTLLDNALVVMIPETYNIRGDEWQGLRGSNPHELGKVPVLLGGGAGGRIRTGRVVNIETMQRTMDLDGGWRATASVHTMGDLWAMVANLMGYNISHWGRPDWNRPGLKERLS
jgi:hypothetical protein